MSRTRKNFRAALLRACYAADKDTIRMLLDEGADPNIAGDDGVTTPLHAIALWLANQHGGISDVNRSLDCVNLLLASGARFHYLNDDGVAADAAYFLAVKSAIANASR